MPLLIVHVQLRWRSLIKGVPYPAIKPANIDYIILYLRAFIYTGFQWTLKSCSHNEIKENFVLE